MSTPNSGRTWTVLLIGGASGTGKSSIAYQLAARYGVSVLEIDDIVQALEAMTTAETLPAAHHWNTGVDWLEVGVNGNVDWLIDVSKEILPSLRAIIDNHLEGDVPVIIEGDFLCPAFAATFDNLKVRSLFIHEPSQEQIVQNYLSREGGDPQTYRAAISTAYNDWLAQACRALGLPLLDARPWDTAVERALGVLS